MSRGDDSPDLARRGLLGATAGLAALGAAPASAAPRTYKRIACEEAFTTPEIVDASRRRANNIPSMTSGPIAGAILPPLLDLGSGRIADMDRDGIDIQVIALTSPGVQHLEAAAAVNLARVVNDRVAEATRAYPKRFAPLATIAPQDPIAAVIEAERCLRELGFCGLMINSHTAGEYLDQPKFWPILEAAEALAAPIYIHPNTPGPGVAGAAIPGFTVGWGFAVETGTHVLRLIGAGGFERFPKLRVVIGHMGEMIPFVLQRLDNRYAFEMSLFGQKALPLSPSQYFRRNICVTTSGMNYATPLRATIDQLGIDNILFAVDYPLEDQARVVAEFDQIPISASDRRRICETNPARVFKLEHML